MQHNATPSYSTLTLTEQNTIATVNLQWPDSGALNQTLLADLMRLIDYLEDESPCTLIVFRGFSTGQPPDKAAPPDMDCCRKWENFLIRLEHFPGASLACIDGFCNRFHLQLALACDYRVATTRSVFQIPEVKEGFLPGMAVFRLPKYTGIGVARRLLFSGTQWSTIQAADWGMIDRQCEAPDFEKAIRDSQQALMPIHPEVLRNVRRLLNESFTTAPEDAIGHFLAVQNLCLAKLGGKPGGAC
uniref:(3,5-dihydroxycyclohex-3-enyl)acetyl-CoA dehydratase subunit B n=1 Tax=Candidatus Kentrum sp. MB TaxID=2138164 RepID=A0A451B8Z6_9GAMM|nr:MAG: (3,5-dihydroxycyclohex-3-enyl)acetyl-CoA dehydratase subunit B [Candidatus Kentron sp. MB]VFK29310.1 MAG: (3,5-dihydroxycyclohex-3-enyl)acetyl-CoA dehydratase subunit B [Candidatus Kentron sp. MB]VFK74741.1 MAG: (3,5-dihydroxycyclohex-3-enyl)acetyl-CoA dehydratase subunit B [Candidatus Kentron sp. MB]